MKLFKKLNKGFTLVELVVVIAVLAILAAVSVVAYTGITKNAKQSAAMSNARAAYDNYLSSSEVDISTLNMDIYVAKEEGQYYTFFVRNGQFSATGTATESTEDDFVISNGNLVAKE